MNYRKDGTPYWTSLSINPVFENSKLVNFIAVQADITRVKQMALDFTNKLHAIGSALVLLEIEPNGRVIEANKLLKDTLSGVIQVEDFAHQLNQQLTAEEKAELESSGFVSKVLELKQEGHYLAFDSRLCALKNFAGEVTRYVFSSLVWSST